MSQTSDAVALAGAGIISLGAAHLLVGRIERVGERVGLSEALLGLVAALAADGPEITTAITALGRHEPTVGAGIVLGSCVFNLAALLGLGATVAGRIALHRRVILLVGPVAAVIVGSGLVAVRHAVPPGAALGVAGATLTMYIAVLATGHRSGWLRRAVAEEEMELAEAIRPEPGRPIDAVAGGVALVAVVVASVVMERAATSFGHRLAIPDIVIGALVLGGLTGLPNAVASTYLARKGRGAAAFSTALNSNNFNVVIGLLVPASAVGLGATSGQVSLVAEWCAALTVVTLALAYASRGLSRWSGLLVLGCYVAFAATVVVVGLG
jgi:cation:H+ antiporter